LAFLGSCKPKIRKLILHNSDKELVNAIQECLYNFLKGNFQIPQPNLRKIKKYKHSIRCLVDSNCFNKKKEILIQKGNGFLPFILPFVPFLGELVVNTVRKAFS
jgi:hypothetical protein